jgi:hypothetical protein
MSDKEFLNWLADRLVNVYGESEYVDFVHKLRNIALAMPPEQCTPNISRIYEKESR